MNLDQLQARWAENDRRLDAALRLNRELLRERAARPFRTRLQLFTLLLDAARLDQEVDAGAEGGDQPEVESGGGESEAGFVPVVEKE